MTKRVRQYEYEYEFKKTKPYTGTRTRLGGLSGYLVRFVRNEANTWPFRLTLGSSESSTGVLHFPVVRCFIRGLWRYLRNITILSRVYHGWCTVIFFPAIRRPFCHIFLAFCALRTVQAKQRNAYIFYIRIPNVQKKFLWSRDPCTRTVHMVHRTRLPSQFTNAAKSYQIILETGWFNGTSTYSLLPPFDPHQTYLKIEGSNLPYLW